MAKLLQPSMSGGELSPGLRGRVDMARYVTGLATCRNFITRATGGVDKRPGFMFRGEIKNSARSRLIPFIYSTDVRYLIEAGPGSFRFWVLADDGSLLQLESSPGVPYEVATPYSASDLPGIHYTQSADVLYLAHPDHPPREVRRLTPSTFELRLYDFRLGPFRSLNARGADQLFASAVTGNITLGANFNAFAPSMVGSLVYLEEKELRGTAPWEAGQKSVGVGSLRRSDGKTYRAVAVSTGGSYHLSGGVRPIHEFGRAWDGSRDVRNDGSADYSVGVEWEYLHSGYGIVKITGYNSPTSVSAAVISRLPDSVIGTAPVAAGTTTFTANGVSLTYPTTFDAQSVVQSNYTVTIDGDGVTQDPYQPPTTGGGGGGGGGGNIPQPPRDQPYNRDYRDEL